ncbi:MAG TPA: hypothetical protein PLR90_03725 [Methylophilus sp.]|nr:hypothetical protein [Methylophilus sp.]HQQ33006.1 hypothetical protein [Methylophilus sp.]
MQKLLTLLLLFTTLVVAEERSQPQAAQVIAVVVPANQDVDALKLIPSKIKLIFLRKQLYWPNGKRILPVNMNTEHPLRSQFSQTVLGSLPSEQIEYWNGMYFNGIRPPHVVNSEEAMLRLLSQNQDAIGYLDACNLDARVKTVFWIVGDEVVANKPELHCEIAN